MAPGTFARLGFDYLRLSEINPRLIFAQVKGFASESTGMPCAMGILAALYQRMTTGRGQHIQIAMRDAMLGARLPHRMRIAPAAFGYHGRTRNQLENLDHGRGDAGGLQS
jgi:crotonobetainyl-CoA:carnitine CoA-transferase CaiB-like acyl-CoA transferase